MEAHLLLQYFNTVLEVLDNAVTQNNKISMNTGEEEAKLLFAENMHVYLESSIASIFVKSV